MRKTMPHASNVKCLALNQKEFTIINRNLLDGDGESRNLRTPVFWLEMESELKSIGNPLFQNDGKQPWVI